MIFSVTFQKRVNHLLSNNNGQNEQSAPRSINFIELFSLTTHEDVDYVLNTEEWNNSNERSTRLYKNIALRLRFCVEGKLNSIGITFKSAHLCFGLKHSFQLYFSLHLAKQAIQKLKFFSPNNTPSYTNGKFNSYSQQPFFS